jgi:hypothetical protein
VCQQSVGLLQRVFDEHGLATVSITQAPEITQLVKPSLACLVAHPFGLTLGAVGDKAGQRKVIQRCLQEATRDHPSGTIVDLHFNWPNDLRERQLRKEAH